MLTEILFWYPGKKFLSPPQVPERTLIKNKNHNKKLFVILPLSLLTEIIAMRV